MAANFFQPGFDEQTENQNIERQRQYAQLLRQQSEQSPQASMVSGHYVAPSFTQGLAQMLKAYQGGKGMREADARQKALAEAVRGRQTEEMGQFTKLLAGTPQEQLPADQFGPPQPGQAPDTKGAYAFAANAMTPALQQVGLRGLAEMPQLEAAQAERVESRQFRKEEAEAMRAQRMQELQMRMEDSRASQAERLAAQKEMREMQIQAQRDTQRMIAANRPERQAQIIQTDSGPAQLVNGQAVPILGQDGKPVRGPSTPGGKPMPATALKMQNEAVDVIGIASSTQADLGTIRSKIKSGQLDFGPVKNLANKGLNAAGISTEQSRNFATFMSTLEKLRNDSLRLNKGVQTDGDAQRAWNELLQNVNDPKLVDQRLGEIEKINARAVDLRKREVEDIRNNYNQPEYDFSTQNNVPSAITPASGGGLPTADAVEAELARRAAAQGGK